ncbi:hypothetical protein [Arsukibacterium sp.]|uniref:hypothetical protein n=1 Tax=Arsukibacterium sp. TaxID=1977258 RepID=UPI002FDB16EB
MALLKTCTRIIGKSLLAIVLFIISCYLLLLIINWQDAKPNTASLHMQSLLQPQQIPAEQNGYQYFIAHNTHNELLLTGSLMELNQQCHHADACSSLLIKQDNLTALLAEQQPLQTFYWQLLQYSQWQEPAPTLQNIPRYQSLMHGQRLLLWQAWLNAQGSNVYEVSSALNTDYQFWTTVMANSNSLISKMVSTNALKWHFQFGAEIIKQLPPEQRPHALPEVWSTALTDQVLSLELVMAGEWHFGADILDNDWLSDPDENLSVVETVFVKLARPLFLLQDTKNFHAQQLLQHDEQANHPWYSWLRNPAGKLMLAGSSPAYADYRQRLQQLEQLKQATLQQVATALP